MQDGAELALALVGNPDWRTAVQGWEAAMFARAEPAAADAWDALQAAFSEDGLANILRAMEMQRGAG
jgi:hypothetical protein